MSQITTRKHELAARQNPAVIVLPICAHGDWGPFASGSGILRLLREVAVFSHRECRTSSLGSPPDRIWRPTAWLAAANGWAVQGAFPAQYWGEALTCLVA